MTSRRKFLATLAGAALVPVVPAAAITVWKPRTLGVTTLIGDGVTDNTAAIIALLKERMAQGEKALIIAIDTTLLEMNR